ncbi:translation initiation factor IF-2-like [Mustela putorius furo]|uniref:Translation initiation factor IF-2-like n=1 Tax=Mustela putorius furo TaxID=9669 RepID=A0A8U0REI6_MUSPF|nr:translation initiation factor IF-2-like [Mustela putorius furo]
MGPPRNEDLTFRTGSARAFPGCVEESGRSPTETPSSSRPSVGLRLPPKAQRGRAPLGSPRLIQRPEHRGTGPGGRRRSPPAAPPSGFLRGLLPTPVPPPALGSACAQLAGTRGPSGAENLAAGTQLECREQRGKQSSTPLPTSGSAPQPRRTPSRSPALARGTVGGRGGGVATPCPAPAAGLPRAPLPRLLGPLREPPPVPFSTHFPLGCRSFSPEPRLLLHPSLTSLGREGAPGGGADPFLPRLLEAVELGTRPGSPLRPGASGPRVCKHGASDTRPAEHKLHEGRDTKCFLHGRALRE